MKKIVIAGGSGGLGKILSNAFVSRGDEVTILTREVSNQSGFNRLHYEIWDGKSVGSWKRVLNEADVLLNLSGASINRIYTEKNKKLLLDSRIEPTRALGEALKQVDKPSKKWINFSGVSMFGGVEQENDESSKNHGNDFLAKLSLSWEKAFWASEIPGVRKIVLRLSPVLQKDAGMLKELLPITKLGLGGQVANGKQYVSWIHLQDFVRAVLWLVDSDAERDVYHAASPKPLTNKEFMSVLRNVCDVPFGLALPEFFARLGSFVKDVDPSLLLQTVRVVSSNFPDEGFIFQYPSLRSAVEDLLKKPE